MPDNRNIPYIIAEIGQAHDGSLGMLYAYIDAVAKTGADAVKFQMHIAEAESSVHEPFRIVFSKQDRTRYDYWKRMSFSIQEWKEIKIYCDEKGLDFICSPFSCLAVDRLEEIGPTFYKIGSGEVTNFLMMEKIARTGVPVILSSGMSSFNELDAAAEFLNKRNVPFSILQCTTAYPTQPEQFGFNVMAELKSRFKVPVGFSDHSARVETCIAATALGAEILEFHVVFDRALFGPDAKASLTFSETTEMIFGIRNIAGALAHPLDKNNILAFSEVKRIFGKSLSVNRDLPAGHVLEFDDLESKKPSGFGIPASDFTNVIGRKLARDLQKWDFLESDDLQ